MLASLVWSALLSAPTARAEGASQRIRAEASRCVRTSQEASQALACYQRGLKLARKRLTEIYAEDPEAFGQWESRARERCRNASPAEGTLGLTRCQLNEALADLEWRD